MLAVQEPMSVLKGTLAGLAEHPGARERYLVVVAMEAGEKGHADKALKLIAEFAGRCDLMHAPVWNLEPQQSVASKVYWQAAGSFPGPQGTPSMQACACRHLFFFLFWLLERSQAEAARAGFGT